MRDLEQSELLLRMARKDLRALAAMTDENSFDTEIFGFHAQQAVEKALKSLLSLEGLQYPLTHDLDMLFGLLEDQEVHVPKHFCRLRELSDFSVGFRYAPLDDLDYDLDRPEVIGHVGELLDHVSELLDEVRKDMEC